MVATSDQLMAKMSAYSAPNHVQLWKRDTRTITGAKKHDVKIASKMPETLKYYQICLCYIHRGMKFVSSNKDGMHINYRKSLFENMFVTFTCGCSFLASRNIANLQARALLISLRALLFSLHEHIITECAVCLAPLKHMVLSFVHKAGQTHLPCWRKKHDSRQPMGADRNF